MKNIMILLSTILFLAACEKQIIPAEQINLGTEYVKFETGHFIEYDVDSIKYDDLYKRVDTFYYQLRDEVAETFLDNQNRKSYVVNRFKRKNDNEKWNDEGTYYITQSSFNIEWVQDNLRFIKLIFPLKLNTTWQGNRYINNDNAVYKDWAYKYYNIAKPYNTGAKIYDNTISVLQVNKGAGSMDGPNPKYDPLLLSAYTFGTETYAKNVGLVYKEITNWENQTGPNQKFKNGFTIIMRAKNNN
jgi:hypothetical protein